ncbi:hypothetical protein JAAARDRAFT_35403 [Jaapia argillacea MUCL 33604]|uniref:Uncharacterized protein n=1 Tax=Jaapia argillacea MUCL 33604 TaxID=933084 RepID=A0A067Q544_9AGAM|nr:hypothetical protein JAAARDRAFT_35403 [Jaapia argillacea MUCL 33604]
MTVDRQILRGGASENWDDDFDFHPNADHGASTTTSRYSNSHVSNPKHMSSLSNSKPSGNSKLQDWAEPGPSTPVKPRRIPPKAENWDDDFEDTTAAAETSPRRFHHRKTSNPQTHSNMQAKRHEPAVENWDADFADSPTHASTSKHSHSSVHARTDSYYQSSGEDDIDDDDDGDLGFADREEDHTITARSRRGLPLARLSPPPPVPPLPSGLGGDPHPFPRSPTASAFSVPTSTSGRDSATGNYSSTAHLALRPTHSGASSALAMLPPSPPIHRERERRRLRKKSRPTHLDGNLMEMMDVAENPPSVRPQSPDLLLSTSPPTQPIAIPTALDRQDHSPVASPSSPPNKTPLLSRIGSLNRKWGPNRKKRMSVGPGDITLNDANVSMDSARGRDNDKDADATPSASTKGSWFFRHAGGSGTTHGTHTSGPGPGSSAQDLTIHDVFDRSGAWTPESPTKPSSNGKKRSIPNLPKMSSSLGGANGEKLFGSPRRPTSMQVPSSRGVFARAASTNAVPVPSTNGIINGVGQRSVSTGTGGGGRRRSGSRSRSKSRGVDSSVEDLAEHEGEHQQGSRSFMGGVRRISLVGAKGKHRRGKSSVGPESIVGDDGDGIPQLPPLPPLTADLEMSRTPPDQLLPPIELQPPSPPKAQSDSSKSNRLVGSNSLPVTSGSSIDALLRPSLPAPPGSPTRTTFASPKVLPPSPYTASLGRSTHSPGTAAAVGSSVGGASGAVPRRNSLGDLKIPARISQAQVGLRRDLVMVKDFAGSVEKLKDLQSIYSSLIVEVFAVLETHHQERGPTPSVRATSPTFFHLPRPGSRARSNTNPQPTPPSTMTSSSAQRQWVSAYQVLEAKYKVAWECAELLIELGGGPPAPSKTPQEPVHQQLNTKASSESRKSRERAVTLAGDESVPPLLPGLGGSSTSSVGGTSSGVSTTASAAPNLGWRASTGRHDLSQRQLTLLRDMLNNSEPKDLDIPEEGPGLVNKHWRWGDAMGSTITLPSEESGVTGGTGGGTSPTKKKRRQSRMGMGMSGLRDMLRSLKRNALLDSSSAGSASASSIDAQGHHHHHHHHHSHTHDKHSSPQDQHDPKSGVDVPTQRRRAKTSTGPESMKSLREENVHHHNHRQESGGTPPIPSSFHHNHRPSPRRPSLASIFRFGQKTQKSTSSNNDSHNGNGSGHSRNTTDAEEEDEDWDEIDSASDLGVAFGISDGMATVKGKKGKSPYNFQQDGGRPITPGGLWGTPPNASQSSLWGEHGTSTATGTSPVPVPHASQSRATRLSNVEESAAELELQQRQSKGDHSKSKRRSSLIPSPSPRRTTSRNSLWKSGKSGSVRSVPPQLIDPPLPQGPGGIALAMTPENIKPLLENAKEVEVKLGECIGELKMLLAVRP